MRTPARFGAVVLLAISGACVHPVVPPLPSGPTPSERLSRADALVIEGCLDCLVEAHREYTSLIAVPGSVDAAAAGAVRAAGILALRERELGMLDEGYFDRAREAASANPAAAARYGAVLDVIDTAFSRTATSGDESVRRVRALNAGRAEWLTMLKARADTDVLSAVTWVWFGCGNIRTPADRTPDALTAPLVQFKAAPVVAYQLLACIPSEEGLTAFQAAHERFHEVDFWLAQRDIARQRLDEAEVHYTSAYKWHDAWPAAMVGLATLYMTAEDFQAALDISDRALAIAPDAADAKLNRLEALSYLSRNRDAIDQASGMIAAGSSPSEAYYWRAWNQNQLGSLDEAWTDIETAERMWHNSEVLKLAGIIAYRRHELPVAKAKFESALQIPGGADCDVSFDLAGVNVELALWDAGAARYAETSACVDRTRQQLADEIGRLQQSGSPPERIARQVARRESMRASALRMQVQSWFNGAVANLQLNRADEARQLALKIVDDQQFGERAREILSRVK